MTANLIKQCVSVGEGVGVVPLSGPRPNEIYWAHLCTARSRWTYSGCPNHTLIGDARTGNLTVRASLICEDCGKHGWITDNTWSEA